MIIYKIGATSQFDVFKANFLIITIYWLFCDKKKILAKMSRNTKVFLDFFPSFI